MFNPTLRRAKHLLRSLGTARADEVQLRRELEHGTVTPSRAADLAAAIRLAQAAVARATAAWNDVAASLTAVEIRRVVASL
jgi:hypothetical protein